MDQGATELAATRLEQVREAVPDMMMDVTRIHEIPGVIGPARHRLRIVAGKRGGPQGRPGAGPDIGARQAGLIHAVSANRQPTVPSAADSDGRLSRYGLRWPDSQTVLVSGGRAGRLLQSVGGVSCPTGMHV
jgi:hypothetical protein